MQVIRPRWLLETTLAMAALTLLDYLLVDWNVNHEKMMLDVTVTSFINLLGVPFLWFYWNGRNWARWFVLFGIPFGNFDLLWSWSTSGPLAHFKVLTEIALYLFLLYWLNTRNVKTYFSGSKSATQV